MPDKDLKERFNNWRQAKAASEETVFNTVELIDGYVTSHSFQNMVSLTEKSSVFMGINQYKEPLRGAVAYGFLELDKHANAFAESSEERAILNKVKDTFTPLYQNLITDGPRLIPILIKQCNDWLDKYANVNDDKKALRLELFKSLFAVLKFIKLYIDSLPRLIKWSAGKAIDFKQMDTLLDRVQKILAAQEHSPNKEPKEFMPQESGEQDAGTKISIEKQELSSPEETLEKPKEQEVPPLKLLSVKFLSQDELKEQSTAILKQQDKTISAKAGEIITLLKQENDNRAKVLDKANEIKRLEEEKANIQQFINALKNPSSADEKYLSWVKEFSGKNEEIDKLNQFKAELNSPKNIYSLLNDNEEYRKIADLKRNQQLHNKIMQIKPAVQHAPNKPLISPSETATTFWGIFTGIANTLDKTMNQCEQFVFDAAQTIVNVLVQHDPVEIEKQCRRELLTIVNQKLEAIACQYQQGIDSQLAQAQSMLGEAQHDATEALEQSIKANSLQINALNSFKELAEKIEQNSASLAKVKNLDTEVSLFIQKHDTWLLRLQTLLVKWLPKFWSEEVGAFYKIKDFQQELKKAEQNYSESLAESLNKLSAIENDEIKPAIDEVLKNASQGIDVKPQQIYKKESNITFFARVSTQSKDFVNSLEKEKSNDPSGFKPSS
ncbi:hypothetical protein [Legionella septentrionalis]|uniref:hypothetical protein n=1 Tax=Legionella septentrionalis TaxID=2498109 RepID=UPI000F8EC1DC|nr:hypothetical protein [Legionella septentrionalis]RUR08948.1 hypothetical protein ELY14_10225 [Legionella septentrionalis]